MWFVYFYVALIVCGNERKIERVNQILSPITVIFSYEKTINELPTHMRELLLVYEIIMSVFFFIKFYEK